MSLVDLLGWYSTFEVVVKSFLSSHSLAPARTRPDSWVHAVPREASCFAFLLESILCAPFGHRTCHFLEVERLMITSIRYRYHRINRSWHVRRLRTKFQLKDPYPSILERSIAKARSICKNLSSYLLHAQSRLASWELISTGLWPPSFTTDDISGPDHKQDKLVLALKSMNESVYEAVCENAESVLPWPSYSLTSQRNIYRSSAIFGGAIYESMTYG